MKRLITEEDNKSLTDDEKKLLQILLDKGLISSASQEKIKGLLGSSETEDKKDAGSAGQSPEDDPNYIQSFINEIKNLIQQCKNNDHLVYHNSTYKDYYNSLIQAKWPIEWARKLIDTMYKKSAIHKFYINEKNEINPEDRYQRSDTYNKVVLVFYKEELEKLLNELENNNTIKENKLAKRLKLLANIEK